MFGKLTRPIVTGHNFKKFQWIFHCEINEINVSHKSLREKSDMEYF